MGARGEAAPALFVCTRESVGQVLTDVNGAARQVLMATRAEAAPARGRALAAAAALAGALREDYLGLLPEARASVRMFASCLNIYTVCWPPMASGPQKK